MLSAHNHSHDHSHAETYGRAFALGVTLNLIFVALELVFGLKAHSLALLADAGHNVSDVASLLLSWGAFWLSRQPRTPKRSYGFRRSSILASLINAVLLFAAVGAIVWEAVQRMRSPGPVADDLVVWVASAGVIINGATALLFASGRAHDLNLRSAFQHMLADAAVSLSVVLAAIGIGLTGWFWLDPAVSLLIAAVITLGSLGLLRESIDLALDAVPATIDPSAVDAALLALPGVTAVHDLHIWAMSTTETALTAHLLRPGFPIDDKFLGAASAMLKGRFGIDHSTIQIEEGAGEPKCSSCG